MEGEMDDFSAECSDELQKIDWEYEYDAAFFYDFSTPESPFQAAQAQRWFETAGNYPPSPLVAKLNLVKETAAAECSLGPSRLREEQTTKSSSSNSSNIHTGSAVSSYKSKIEEPLSIDRMAHESPKAKINSETRSFKARVSTLMNPTASHLAKLRSQKPPSKADERSSWNSSVSFNLATKRQKLESGYLRKVTIPRDPQLETMQRALRRRPNTQNAAKQGNSVTTIKSKALRCNKIFPSSEDTRICENIGERSTTSMDCNSTVDTRLPMHPPVELFNKVLGILQEECMIKKFIS
uniref:TPX2 central domain-containing protein n=1 Tax=Solanum tuberosum TaxID=4113 RepID=M1CPE8_SOLTU